MPADSLAAFLQVVAIDLVMAGDNAIVIGLAAAGLPANLRNRAIMIGVAAATVLRIIFALLAAQLLQIIGLMLAGGVLLLWVGWKMWRELRIHGPSDEAEAIAGVDLDGDGRVAGQPRKTLRGAAIQIILADLSMSLDNVLGVSGAAYDHPVVLVFGLMLSVFLMGVAASFIAKLLTRHRWIAYIGLAVILFVALRMIWEGGNDLLAELPALGGGDRSPN
ncbi:YjbE family putative metal transport protein [bacterium]|nr:YjbE family putative metal transport protein [bacterium]